MKKLLLLLFLVSLFWACGDDGDDNIKNSRDLSNTEWVASYKQAPVVLSFFKNNSFNLLVDSKDKYEYVNISGTYNLQGEDLSLEPTNKKEYKTVKGKVYADRIVLADEKEEITLRKK